MHHLLSLHELIVILDLSGQAAEHIHLPCIGGPVAAGVAWIALGKEITTLVRGEGVGGVYYSWALLLVIIKSKLLDTFHGAETFKETHHVVVGRHVYRRVQRRSS